MQNLSSPRWNSTTKVIIAMILIALIGGLLIKFQGILPPLLMAFALVYLFYPVAAVLNRRLHLPWGLAVALVYLILILVILSFLTAVGLELVYQVESLIGFVQNSLNQLPGFIANLSNQVFTFGNFRFELSTLDLNSLSGQAIDTARGMLGQTGELIATVAGGAANVVGWSFFVFLLSYFILVGSNGLSRNILHFDIPGYSDDMYRLRDGLAHIWNAFLRGQIIVIGIAVTAQSIVLSVLGANYSLGLALLAGFARFLPYIGSLISWTTIALVAYFQPTRPFGLSSFPYMLLVLAFAWAVDSTIDNFVSPRIMAAALKVHPAAVLVAAIIALDLFGILGVIVAAPILATLQLIIGYLVRKLFDQDPWQGVEAFPPPPPIRQQVGDFLDRVRMRFGMKGSAK